MLINRASRYGLCNQLRQLRAATVDLERSVLTDTATPAQLAAKVLALREHLGQIAHAASELLPDSWPAG